MAPQRAYTYTVYAILPVIFTYAAISAENRLMGVLMGQTRGKAEKTHTRSLTTQVLAGMIAMLAFCVLMVVTIFANNMRKMSMQAEHDHFEEMGKALHSMVTESLDGLYEMTRAYSSYDETYWFARGYNTSYLMRFFEDGSTLAIGDVDFVVILDKNGDELFSGARFVEADVPLEPVPAGLRRRVALSCGDVIQNHRAHNGTFQVEGPVGETGFVVVDGQSYQLCVLPILRDRDDGEPVGVFAFAKKFGNEQIRELTNLDVSEFTIAEQDRRNPVQATAYEIDGDRVLAHTPIESRDGSPNAVLTFATPRTLYNNVNSIMSLTIVLFVLFIVSALTALFLFLNFSLVKPLKRLTVDLRALDESGGLDTGKYSGTREFFTLTSTVNNTLSRLEESHRAEERSKVSLNILKNILNGMDAYLYVMDPETDKILFINDNMKTHFGIEGDGVGQVCWQVLQSGFTERCSFCPNQWLEEHPGEKYVWEEHNTATGGYYRNTDRLIDWADGKKAHMQHSVDITDIKLAEQKLQRRLEQQALMTKISKIFISGEDAAANVDRALAMAGEFVDASRVMYLPLSEHKDKLLFANEWLSPKEHLPSRQGGYKQVQGDVLAFLEQFAAGAITHVCVDKNNRRGFELGFAETPAYLAVPVLANDELYGLLDFGDSDPDTEWSESDLSLAQLMASILSGYFGRLAAEDQIRLLSSIVEYSSVLITNIERDGTLIYVNDAVLDITGYTVNEFMQCGLPLLFGADEMRLIETKYIPEVVKNGECRFEIELTRKDGAKRTISYSTFMMGGAEGTIGAIASDITDLRELERQLTAARDLAEQGNRAKTEFLSRMSHEMRTPMNAIIGMTNIAMQSEEAARKEHCLERIDSASRHLLGVINDILDMSKIEAKKFELSITDFSFAAMMKNVINVVNFRLDEKHQKMVTEIDPQLPDHLVGDEQRLAQVLTNLLSNAAKFTPENGKVGLSVKVESQKWADLVLEFTVQDNGIGISPEQLGRLFRPFEQADGSISRRFGGTGLGLAISKQIVSLMGGDIRVESELGRGSRFIFTVNVRKAADLGIEPLSTGDGADDGTVDGIFEGKRVLLAEDVEVNCEIVKAILEDTGVQLDTASNGTEAVRKFSANPAAYDMILMDVQMPEKDGMEATREIRALAAPQGKTVPIIALTANVFREDVERYLQEGMNGHVQKPVDFDELIRVMRKFIGKAVAGA